MKVGLSCLAELGVTRVRSRRGRPKNPVAEPVPHKLSRMQIFALAIKKFKAPFHFVRRQYGSFKCLCLGTGRNQVVLIDDTGKELVVGAKCAAKLGVPVPPKAAPAINQGGTQHAK